MLCCWLFPSVLNVVICSLTNIFVNLRFAIYCPLIQVNATKYVRFVCSAYSSLQCSKALQILTINKWIAREMSFVVLFVCKLSPHNNKSHIRPHDFNAIHFYLWFILNPPTSLRLLADDNLRTKKKAKLQTMTNEQIFINRATQTLQPQQQPTRNKPTTTTSPTKSTAPELSIQTGRRSMALQASKVSHSKATIKPSPPLHLPQQQHEHFGPTTTTHNHDHWLCQKCGSGPDCRRSFNKNRKKRNRFQPNRNHKPNSPKALWYIWL